MAHVFRVDLPALESTAHGLELLSSEFKKAKHTADDARRALGNDHLADALHDFASNWNYHAGKLEKLLDAVTEMAHDSHDTIVTTDHKLAASVAVDAPLPTVVPHGPKR